MKNSARKDGCLKKETAGCHFQAAGLYKDHLSLDTKSACCHTSAGNGDVSSEPDLSINLICI
jgi:hypothetical protein